MGRKRNKGKARRVAKAKAREEAERRGDDYQTANSGRQSLSSLMQRQLQIGEKKCMHGFDPPSDDNVHSFISALHLSFIKAARSGDRTFQDCLIRAKNVTLNEFAKVWNDLAKMEMAISHLLYSGTKAILAAEDRVARDFATFARFFEQHIAFQLKQTQALYNWIKIEQTYFSDDHTLVKFFWKRIPCSCLDDKYKEVKHIPKMGTCYNKQCSVPSRFVERRKAKYCSRCRDATYCSRECQVADWRMHKPNCDNNAALIAEFEAKRQE